MSKILCIEDEKQLRCDLFEVLSDTDHEILLAKDGQEGLEMIIKHQPDLVVSDITMPRLDGHQLVKLLRSEYPQFANVPFIFLSALADRDSIMEGMEMGADCYLTKPVDFDLFLCQIETSLRQICRIESKTTEQLVHMANHDALTGLPNRFLLEDRLNQALMNNKRGQYFGLLLLDLDRFKTINDSLGHLVGDQLLISVAQRLQGCVRETDTIARFGGDEFLIIHSSCNQPHDAEILAQRILEAMQAPFELADHTVNMAVSIGIAFATTGSEDSKTLITKADLALYQVKEEGCGQYRIFNSDMDEKLTTKRQLEIELRDALRNEEFELLYQPILSAETSKITGFEALLRWNHPVRGVISPEQFIPIAEATGDIVPIGEWVIRTACMQAAAWPSDTKIAVNVSPVQFRGDGLVPIVFSALQKSGIPPSRLELEITESMLFENNPSTIQKLSALRDFGICIAIDDFGTGYSSLSLLRSFPFGKIKIDKSFVGGMVSDNTNSLIVDAIVGMGAGLRILTTAEGVETSQQLAKVREAGCTEVQGYLFSKPVPVSEINQMFEEKEIFPMAVA